MRILLAALFALFLAVPAKAAELIPIQVSNGHAKITCNGQFHFMNTTPLNGQQVVATYMFGNLLTTAGQGADVSLWSPSYETAYPEPYAGGPNSKWGKLGHLHIFSQPQGHTGGRQGDQYMSFQPDGITINDYVQVVAICWGGGTLEIYAQIWVRPAP